MDDDDGSIFYLIGPLIAGLILYFIIGAIVRAPGGFLRDRFAKLGSVQGRTLKQIVSIVGAPTSRSVTGNGLMLYQWMATGYHIALLFENGICLGVTHEFGDVLFSGASAVISQPAIPGQASPQLPAPDADTIPCPLCRNSIKIAAIKEGDNWCPHCLEKFIADK